MLSRLNDTDRVVSVAYWCADRPWHSTMLTTCAVYITNRSGPSTAPWGTPNSTATDAVVADPNMSRTTTRRRRLDRNRFAGVAAEWCGPRCRRPLINLRASVGRSVCPVHCGKMADRIRMPFGIRTGPWMSQVVGFGDRSTRMGRPTFGGEFGTRHCNLRRFHGVRVRQCLNRRSCRLEWCVRWAEALLYYMGSTSCKGKGEVLGVLFPIFTMGNAIRSPTVRGFQFVYENLTTFPFGKRIVGKLDSWAFGDIFGFEINVGLYEKLAKK